MKIKFEEDIKKKKVEIGDLILDNGDLYLIVHGLNEEYPFEIVELDKCTVVEAYSSEEDLIDFFENPIVYKHDKVELVIKNC